MLQCGGSTNNSAALLRQYFLHEERCEEHARRLAIKSGGSPRGNRTGVLPVITANTDVASLRRSPRKRDDPLRPRLTKGSPRYPLPYDLPHQGIGFKVDDAPRPTSLEGPRSVPSHGKLPPYGRRLITKEFYDDVSGGGIACLHPQYLTSAESPSRRAKGPA